MNKQAKSPTQRGIEWTDYTWNPIGGCLHACRWTMPDGSVAQCYAETVAEGVAQAAYPQGFGAHYWHPERLAEPLTLKAPARIFIDSMSDLFGNWVPADQIYDVLAVCEAAHWHDFQVLTKNAPRLLHFRDAIPQNVWIGVSAPPTQMFGQSLLLGQQMRMVSRQMSVLADFPGHITWMSAEPLSWDIGVEIPAGILDWLVIGAASRGATLYQPDPKWVQNLLDLAGDDMPVFFKGNLAWPYRREEFPRLPYRQPEQMELFK